MSTSQLQRIKLITISALVSDDLLMGILVLKGGNALDLAYDISNRGSIDIDFSMEKDFTEKEKQRVSNQIQSLLKREFDREGLNVFDVRLLDKPSNVHDSVKSFWGGYTLEFKVIDKEKFERHKEDTDALRRNALPIYSDSSTKFTVDISKYEYVADKRAKDIEGASVYVYSPEMLAIEKLRALCQQLKEYRNIVISMTSRPRARDFYDIYNLTLSFSIDYKTQENMELVKHIFEAKKVPLSFICAIADQREFHKQDWESVRNTVSVKEGLQDFDFYFDFVLSRFSHFC